ncbi:MAG TPA: YafY family protein [Stellaceae bacterium]|nr:YafY family protein [Stellaceae bacterium]
MARSERLLALIQILRRHRRPVAGTALAAELAVSLRTVYRDIASLVATGAPIDGEAGVGFVLRDGYTLPPLMFSEEEIEALVLGSRMVAQSADRALARAARDALAKITAVLPGERRDEVASLGLISAPRNPSAPDGVELARLRAAIRAERKVWISYGDEAGNRTERRIWPIALTFYEKVRLLAAWCELRQGFRHFRADRIIALSETPERFPRRRRVLMREWRATEGLPELD